MKLEVTETIPADAQPLFEETLTCHPCLPARFEAMEASRLRPQHRLGHAESLLRLLAQVEDSHGAEESEEHSSLDLALQRIEARLELLSEQVTVLLRQHREALPESELTWSLHGLSLVQKAPVQVGDHGLVLIELVGWLPRPLELPATVVAVTHDGGTQRLWLKFSPREPATDSALHRHLFRLHRREVAEARRQR